MRRLFIRPGVDYELRPKFHPDFATRLDELSDDAFEEYQALHPRPTIMDARRVSDGTGVILKRVSTKVHPDEVEISRLFSTPPCVGNPRNHCIPVFQILQDPEDADTKILVMPQMLSFNQPIFDTVGEVINCFRQLFEGIEFMHENFVAHRTVNFVQDPADLYPHGFHPVETWRTPGYAGFAPHMTRTQCWPRYHIIDFGLSRRYDPKNGPPLEDVILGADRTPPEHSQDACNPCNPFPTDIYFLGNLLKREFVYSLHSYESPKAPRALHRPLRFLKPLMTDMTSKDPAMRPTIGEVIQRFDVLCSGLGEWHLRQPGRAFYPYAKIGQRLRQIKNTLKRVPPLPPYTPRARTPLTDEMRAFYTQTPLISGGNPTDPGPS